MSGAFSSEEAFKAHQRARQMARFGRMRLVEEKAEPDGVVVTLLAYSLEWLARWVFSLGSMAEVVAPERLKDLIATEARQVAAKYITSRKAPVRSFQVENVVTD